MRSELKQERAGRKQIAQARLHYPKYFEDYDIEADMAFIEDARSYAAYRNLGGFLDKLSYFEVLSILRSDEKTQKAVKGDLSVDEKASTKTAKCPDCGKKYLVATNYCATCKKKVKAETAADKDEGCKKKKNESEVITVAEDVRIPGTDIILEKGDLIRIIQ